MAQTKLEATDIVNHPFSEQLAPGGKLRLRVRSGDIRVIGTAEGKVSVELSGRNVRDARNVKVRFARMSSRAYAGRRT